jgi:hypothetical protein
VLGFEEEPIAELNEEEAVAEVECPIDWNRRAAIMVDFRGSERQR